MGKIIHEDKREILLLTLDKKEIYLPQHILKERVLLSDSDFDKKAKFIGEDNPPSFRGKNQIIKTAHAEESRFFAIILDTEGNKIV